MRKLLCTILVVGLLATGAWAQTTITVPTDQPTVHAAVLAANAGDTVYILNGTYALDSTLNINEAITIQGESEANVVFDVNCGADYGMQATVGGVTFRDFTLNVVTPSGEYAGYALRASGTPNVQDGLTVMNVTVQGSGGVLKRRAGVDIHGYDNVVLNNVTSKDATWGNGIQITGCVNVDVDNCTTMNNAWGSLSIYCSQYLVPNRACDSVDIDGTTCSFGENNVFIENQFGLTSTNVVVSGYDYLLTNDEFRTGAEGFIFIKDTLADVQAHALAAFGGFEGATALQEIATGEYVVDATLGIGMTIQGAIDAASPGDVVNVGAGTFREQLIIDKSLTLAGAGEGVTTIEAPDPIDRAPYSITVWTGSSKNVDPVIGANAAGTVHVRDLTVDGRDTGPNDFYGIHFFDTSGSITDCTVVGIHYPAGPGAQNVLSIVATQSASPGALTIDISDNTVPSFQKGGIAVKGPDQTFTVNNNQISANPSPDIAGNGIQLSYGATGSTLNNVVSGVGYTGDDWAGTGILLFECGDVTMTGDTVTGSQSGVNYSDWRWVYAHPSPVNLVMNNLTLTGNEWSLGFQLSGEQSDLVLDVNGGAISNSGGDAVDVWGTGIDPWGGSYYTGWNNGDLTVDIEGLSIDGTAIDAIWTGDFSGNATNVVHGFDVTECSITGSTGYAMANNFPETINAPRNYWDDPAGPTVGAKSLGERRASPPAMPAGFDLPEKGSARVVETAADKAGGAVTGPIVASPWYGLPPGTSPMTWGTSTSIQAAIDAANPGDVIEVEAGTYTENVTVNKSLTLLGANADAVCGARGAESVISPASGLPVNITADGVVFNGFEVTTAAYQYGIILSGTSNVEVVHNNVHDINSSATPVIANTFGIYYSVPNGEADSDVVIADNCIDNIASSDVTGSSCAAIGVLQSTSTGTLSDLVIARNTITDVNVNTGSWPTGKIAYGMILNTGSSGYLTTTGKIVDAVIEDNVIDGLSGFISTAIGLEGNTENAHVSGNVIANLYGAKTADRSGGGYDLNGIKFESNRYVGTVTVEYNSIDRTTFNHDGTMDRGYAVANYVPVGDAYGGGTTSTAIVTCNWFGTADAGAIADAADLTGAILNKDGAETDFIPFLVTSDIVTPDCSGGSSVATLPAVSGPINCGDTVVLSIDYTPDALAPGLRGYSVTLGATTGVLSFGAGDITISNALDPTDSGEDLPQIVNNGDGTFTVDNGILGSTSGLTSAATLFTVEIHPVATGSGTVDLLDVTLRDVDNVGIPTSVDGAAITVDCTAPPAATDYAAAPGPDSVRLTWTMADPSDVDHYELYRAVWHTGDNVTSAYPEYDDVHGPVLRQADYDGVTGSVEWTDTPIIVAGTETSYDLDDALARGIYWYELFSVDAAGNVSPMTAEYVRATNYFLGDFDADGEVVGTGDLSPFGFAYGETWPVGTHYPPESFFDIGPTDDFSGLGLPSTDNKVGFEDLMILALNYETVAKQDRPAAPASVALNWTRLDQDTWALELNEPCEGLLGLNVRAPLPEGVSVTVERGELLDQQGTPAFLATAPDGLDIGLAALGQGFTGQGELLRVTAAGVEELSPAIDARGHDNAAIDVELTMSAADLPTVLALDQNQPNPFNPSTTIKFDLPQRGRVDLKIYALDGSLVRTLVSEVLDPGRHDVAWQGRDDSGRAVASGTYFYRMVADGETLVRKMTLMK